MTMGAKKKAKKVRRVKKIHGDHCAVIEVGLNAEGEFVFVGGSYQNETGLDVLRKFNKHLKPSNRA